MAGATTVSSSNDIAGSIGHRDAFGFTVAGLASGLIRRE
jgi:hypothetical protein